MTIGLSSVLANRALVTVDVCTLTHWDTESYPADSTASPKRRCAARKTSNERAT